MLNVKFYREKNIDFNWFIIKNCWWYTNFRSIFFSLCGKLCFFFVIFSFSMIHLWWLTNEKPNFKFKYLWNFTNQRRHHFFMLIKIRVKILDVFIFLKKINYCWTPLKDRFKWYFKNTIFIMPELDNLFLNVLNTSYSLENIFLWIFFFKIL